MATAAERRPPAAVGLSSRQLLLVTGLALAVRVAFLLLEPAAELLGDEPTWRFLGVRGLAKLRRPFSPIQTDLIFYPPAYPYLVGLGYAMSGSLQGVKWLQVVISSLLAPAAGRVGGLCFSARAGLLAAVLVALYPDLIWFSTHLWSETLFMTLLWWGFERLLVGGASEARAPAVTSGVLWGLAALTRDTVLYFIPFAWLWLIWTGRRQGKQTRGAAFLLAALLTVAPWTVRNWIVFRAFVPISTTGSFNLWLGNTRLPREQVYEQSGSVEGAIPQERLARRMAGQAIVERQPLWLWEKLRSEMPRFWEAQSEALEHLDRGAYGPVAPATRMLAKMVVLALYLLVLALFVLGLSAIRLDDRRGLLLGFLLYYNALHVVAFGDNRFRLPVMPVVFLIAASFVTGWREGTLPRFTPRRRLLAAALMIGAALLLAPSLR